MSVTTAVILLLAAGPRATESKLTCVEVANKLLNCMDYVEHGGNVPPSCCSGVKDLKAEAASADDRRAACECLKTLAKQVPGINPDLAAAIPGKCGVDIGYPISLSVDCSKYVTII
ncbi:Non-specific lipid-transfer protein 1 [Apostasia shenzhenica]|uniref:Non-specific lipid-transfer protein n=1 Tax=Apostasia shenzhenica TaxID=1088818 RepID=A0A2I0APZ0_9ASPA|nr:Non-specific lipid-transfer protein 1 [Apostasia shenzhenica]